MHTEHRPFDRRKSPRVELKGITGLPANPGLARIIDISAGGAQVEFTARLVPGNHYEMNLTFPDRTIRARALVVRSVDLPGSDSDEQGRPISCLAGLEFQDLDTADHHYLEGFVAGQAALTD
jgi:hypothetical protein